MVERIKLVVQPKTGEYMYRIVSLVFTFLIAYVLGLEESFAQIETIERVSIASDGTQANADSNTLQSAISSDGRYIAFASSATNLVSDDTNEVSDVFVRDRLSGTTKRISISNSGAETNGASFRPAISSNGRYITFYSEADNLSSIQVSPYQGQIFLYDQQSGQTELISMNASGSGPSGTTNYESAVSDDGRYVAFISSADDLIAQDNNRVADVFLRDRNLAITARISVSSDNTASNGACDELDMTPDGRYLLFTSQADNLVSNDTNRNRDLFLRDTQTGITSRINVATDGSQSTWSSGFGTITHAEMSSDGRYIVFDSDAINLDASAPLNTRNIFLRDSQSGNTSLISRNSSGDIGNSSSLTPSISDDGRFVCFNSPSTNFVENDTNQSFDVFLLDRTTNQTTRLDLTLSGSQSSGDTYSPVISGDGNYVVFSATADDIVSDDTNKAIDVFVAKSLLIVTPDTPLQDPPLVTVKRKTVKLILQKFAGVALTTSTETSLFNSFAFPLLEAVSSSTNLSIRYDARIRRQGSSAKDVQRIVSKRNSITLRNMSPGTYTARYRVNIMQGKKLLGKTKFSPKSKFRIQR